MFGKHKNDDTKWNFPKINYSKLFEELFYAFLVILFFCLIIAFLIWIGGGSDTKWKVADKYWQRSQKCQLDGQFIDIQVNGEISQEQSAFWPDEKFSGVTNCIKQSAKEILRIKFENLNDSKETEICFVDEKYWGDHSVGDEINIYIGNISGLCYVISK